MIKNMSTYTLHIHGVGYEYAKGTEAAVKKHARLLAIKHRTIVQYRESVAAELSANVVQL